MKQTTILKRDELGFVEKGRMGINIELIWEQSESEEEFAEEFAKTFAHELLHIELAKALGKMLAGIPEVIEEETIRAMLDEDWDEELAKLYAE